MTAPYPTALEGLRPATAERTWAAVEWPLWTTTARLVVTDGALLSEARHLVDDELAAVERAVSRFRADSEIVLAARSGRSTNPVSGLLADFVEAALDAAWLTDGFVDPTLGSVLTDLGYDRDIAELDRVDGPPTSTSTAAADDQPGWTVGAEVWQQVEVERLGRAALLTAPAGVILDLGATAKAVAADRCAALVADRLRCGTLVSLGGDIATAGPAAQGWEILVQDTAADPAATIRLPAGAAVATSSTVRRRWRHDGEAMHHLIDPRTRRPTGTLWRAITVASGSCWHANTLTTAAIVHGRDAVTWLAAQERPARLVAADGGVHTVNGWPDVQAPDRATDRAPDRPAVSLAPRQLAS